MLVQIAALVVGESACSLQRSSCDGFVPVEQGVDVPADVACNVAAAEAQLGPGRPTHETMITTYCYTACGGGFNGCALPDDYVAAYHASQSAAADGGAVGCPSFASSVKLMCSSVCEGRRTSGVDDPEARQNMSVGDYLAACSYLESASVHAFARLRAELAAHGAPRDLLDAAEEAERDEVRHTELTRALAMRFGVEPRAASVGASEARPLFDIARENAVEGCVRETYGAIAALVRAARAKDPHIRATMRSIAHDECRHAELSWRIAEWAMPRLRAVEQEELARSMHEAVGELARAQDDASSECRSFLGLPSARERRVLVAQLAEALTLGLRHLHGNRRRGREGASL